MVRVSVRRVHALASTSILGLAIYTTPVFAQERASEETGVSEIIVTAQKREQRLQDVPIAVTALGEDSLRANRVQNVMDLTGLAPGLLARANAGGQNAPAYSLRGVFASAAVPMQDRQIATYVDGVYITGIRGAVFDLPDVQRIEVLRGPQGTLFGRNATAGAISVVTRNPTGEYALRQEVTIGNFDQFRTRTTVDLPQIGPLTAFVTFVHDERHGDTRNLGAGTPFDRTSPFHDIGATRSPKWLGNKNAENLFAAVRFAPHDEFSITYKFDYARTTHSPEARVPVVLNPKDFVGGMLAAILNAQPVGGGRFGPVVLNPDNKRPNSVNNGWTQTGLQKSYGHNFTTEWQPTNNLSIKNITAFRKTSIYGPSSIMGLDGLEYNDAAKAAFTAPLAFLGGRSYAQALGRDGNVPIGSFFAAYVNAGFGRTTQASSEVQVNYDSSLLALTVGGIWFHSSEYAGGLYGMRPITSFGPTPSLLPLGAVEESRSKTNSFAAYLQAEVHVTPQLDLVLGGRITRDKKTGSLTSGGTFEGDRYGTGQVVGTKVVTARFTKTKPTYSVGLNYKPSGDIMVFGKYSTAFLSGGAVGDLSFDPETVESWEAGLKSEWLNRRLQVNLALYQATYKHSQSAQAGLNVGRSDLGVVVIDNGSLKAKGAELDVVLVPAQGLKLGATMGYTDARLVNPNPIVTQGRQYKLGSNPKWIGSLNAQYVSPAIFADAYFFFRLDASFQGKFRAIPFPDISTTQPIFAPFEYNPSRWIVNGRAALRDVKIGTSTVEVGLWGRNLLNNKDPLYPLLFSNIQYNASYQPARTYGLDILMEF